MYSIEDEPKSGLAKLEYKVREKTVYFVTRYCVYGETANGEFAGVSSTVQGQFEDAIQAHRVAHALCRADALSYGVKEDDPRVVFPDPPKWASEPVAQPA